MATEVVLPNLGLTTENGSILRWFKKEGDDVEKGESLFEVEADKVTTEVESPTTGILGKIIVPENVQVPVLTVVAIIVTEGEAVPEQYLRVTSVHAPRLEGSSQKPVTLSEPDAMRPGPSRTVRAVPAARRLAREYGVDLTVIKGSGPGGTVLKSDVEDFMTLSVAKAAKPEPEKVRATRMARKLAEKEGITLAGVAGTGTRGRVGKGDIVRAIEEQRVAASVSPPGEEPLGRTIPMTRMRKLIAQHMCQSAFTAPHVYFFTEVEMTRLIGLRKEILPDFEEQLGAPVSINDFIIKAVGVTIREYPILNATVDDENIRINPEINVGLAVAVDEGLIVPAIPNADRAGLGQIAKQRVDLVDRARAGKLTLAEIERGTFTISSLAQFDITFFTAILNPPQSGILSVGKLDEKLCLVDGEVTTRAVACFGLSVDHRIIDGVLAAAFLQALKKRLENPLLTFFHL